MRDMGNGLKKPVDSLMVLNMRFIFPSMSPHDGTCKSLKYEKKAGCPYLGLRYPV